MSTVVDIEKALQALPVEDARKVADWLQQYLDEKWDKQIDADIAAGKLDKLADKAMQDYHAGRIKPLDEVIDQS
jgi:urease accessory protein UreF